MTRPDAIATRLETYHRETEPIVEHYRTTGKLVPCCMRGAHGRGLA